MRPFELRTKQGGGLALDAYASRFDVPYAVGPVSEVVTRGAFERSLTRRDLDVVLRVEHKGLPLARTISGTLRLSEDDVGLRAQADLDERNPRVQELASGYERGDLGQMSFAFRVHPGGDRWSEDRTKRTVRSADIHRGDVSIVAYGASPTTSSTLSRREMRAMAERLRVGWFGPGLLLRQEPALTPSDDEDQAACPDCAATGVTDDGYRCPACDGTGVVAKDDLGEDERERSAKRSSAPTVAELERRAAVAKSRAAEARFERDYGDRLVEIEAQHVMRYGELASEALRRGDTRSASHWVQAEIVELERLAAGL